MFLMPLALTPCRYRLTSSWLKMKYCKYKMLIQDAKTRRCLACLRCKAVAVTWELWFRVVRYKQCCRNSYSLSLPSNDYRYYTAENNLRWNKFRSNVWRGLHWYSFLGGLRMTTRVTPSCRFFTTCLFMSFIVRCLTFHITIPGPTKIRW